MKNAWENLQAFLCAKFTANCNAIYIVFWIGKFAFSPHHLKYIVFRPSSKKCDRVQFLTYMRSHFFLKTYTICETDSFISVVIRSSVSLSKKWAFVISKANSFAWPLAAEACASTRATKFWLFRLEYR